MANLYIQPACLVAGRDFPVGNVLPLAGGPLYFSGGMIIERGKGSCPKSRYLSVAELLEVRTSEVRELLDKIVSRRSFSLCNTVSPLVMGIVNVTPDSFSDGGFFLKTEDAITQGKRLISEGANILDIGGESTRPGALPVSFDVERNRVVPVLKELRFTGVPLSVDTRDSRIMKESIGIPVDMINDVSALTYDSESISVLASASCMVILVHAGSTPNPSNIHSVESGGRDDHLILDVYDDLEERIRVAVAGGIDFNRIIIDPGFGFGKGMIWNLELMRRLSLFHGLGLPLMLGASRKGTIGVLTGTEQPAERVSGSVAMALAGIAQGVHILRVHDVKATCQAVRVWIAATRGV